MKVTVVEKALNMSEAQEDSKLKYYMLHLGLQK
jgi:hypothetical protein